MNPASWWCSQVEFTLVEIEALKREVRESQYKVASLTKKVETSNNCWKLTIKALEKANLEIILLKDTN